MSKLKQLIGPQTSNLSVRALARALGLSVGAVSKYKQALRAAGIEATEAQTLSESQLEQRVVSLPGDDGANDLHARRICHIRDNVVQLQVHERQCFLHVLDVRGGVIKMPLAKSKINSQCSGVATRPKARTQQSAGMQSLQSLRVIDVDFATR